MKLSILIPLYNEENQVEELLHRLYRVKLPGIIDSCEVLIIDDCSSDKSCHIVSEFIKDKLNYRLIKLSENLGKGYVLKTGIAESDGDLILFIDSDLELIPEDIPSIIHALDDPEIKMVNGSRYLPGIQRPVSSYWRFFWNKKLTQLVSLLVNVKISDMASGLKLIHRDILDKIELKENRFGFETELMIKSLRYKKNILTEIPVHYYPRNEGDGKKFKNKDGINIIWVIIKYGLLKLYI